MVKKLVNREVSWLHFNERVLQEAMDVSNPIIERLRFLGIFSNNRDEFFRVRVATIKRMIQFENEEKRKKDVKPSEILQQILSIVEDQELKFTDTFHRIIKDLQKHHIYLLNENSLDDEQGDFIFQFFNTEVRPLLFPIMLNNLSQPGNLRDNSIYLAAILQDSKGKKEEDYALIMVPDTISRFVQLPPKDGKKFIMFVDDVLRYCMSELFGWMGFDTFSAYTIKLTRDAELDIDHDVSKSFMELMSESIKKRKKGSPVRFVYDDEMPDALYKKLARKLKVTKTDNIRGGGRYHNFKDFMSFPNMGGKNLVYKKSFPSKHPLISHNTSIIDKIKKEDIMLHYPYQSFQYIVDLLREASIDPKVRAIKMTFYRAARDSNVINALINAARNGKNVTVFLEIQARFDEKANIYWSRKLEEEGVKIIKTLPGFKVHSKLMLIRRKESGKNVYYANISTGNFNESTAKVYADDSLLTAHQGITNEVNMLFHLFESPYNPPKFKHLIVAPYYMRNNFMKKINTEIRNAKAGKEAWIIIKLNNLVDKKITSKLYSAAKAGVKINIICRGICILIPGLKGISENINVISIVDKFLEHSRVFVFANGGDTKYYLSSADWMVRNFDHRFETAAPIYDKKLQSEVMAMLKLQLSDNTKARMVNSKDNNEYVQTKSKTKVRSQFKTFEMFSQ
ncbi:MAG: polyphosphate kinase 1 [Marinilabiliales bacterium]|nr:MAG: polyphosphate kinase 1 [Marinilabiliales bacterium]